MVQLGGSGQRCGLRGCGGPLIPALASFCLQGAWQACCPPWSQVTEQKAGVICIKVSSSSKGMGLNSLASVGLRWSRALWPFRISNSQTSPSPHLLYSVPVIWASMRKERDCRLEERRAHSSASSSGLFWFLITA